MLYNRYTKISGNIIKHNLRTLMNERTQFFYKNISLTFYPRKGWCFRGVWEMGGETYTQREDFFPYLLPGARGCQPLHPLASSSERHLVGCVSHARQRFSALYPNLTVFFSSCDLLPVTHLLYPSALIALLFTNLNMTACQSTRSHQERTENPSLCYITCINLFQFAHIYLSMYLSNSTLFSFYDIQHDFINFCTQLTLSLTIYLGCPFFYLPNSIRCTRLLFIYSRL